MTSSRDLPELVRDSELQATIRENVTTHSLPLGRQTTRIHTKWHRVKLLGHGGGGVVWLEQKTEGPGIVDLRAVKCIHMVTELKSGEHKVHRYRRELEALAKFTQQKYTNFFVKSYGWYTDPQWLYIAMEYCENLDLGTYLKEKKRLSERDAWDIASQVLGGLTMMHENGFAHRDLKPANILIKNKPPDDWWVKLCDLGLSRRSGDASGSTTVRGTPDFMAPETIGRPFHGDPRLANDFCADMWCLGETISRILTGRPTFEHHTLLQYQEGSIEFPEEPLRNAGASKRAIDFVRSLMHANPDRRLRAKQALLHPWLEFDPDGGQADNKLQSPTDGSEDIPVDYTGNPSDDQVTQASGEWTATMSLHAEDTQPSAKWTETVADPGDGLITQTNVGNSSAMDIAPPKPMGKGDIVDGGGKLQSNLPRYRRILLPPSALPRPLLPDHAAKKSSTAPAEAKGARAADTDREPTSKTKHSVDRTQRPSPGKRYTVVRPNPADEIRAMMERQRQLRSAKDAQKPKATPTQTLEVKLERDVPAWFRWVVGKVSS